jgi:hypothetical protein
MLIPRSLAGCLLASIPLAALAQAPPIQIALAADLTDAPRKLIHATETIPVTPGPLTLVYPKWIPGEHGPTGPIGNLAGLLIACSSTPVKWQRDNLDMYAFHLTVPAGCTLLTLHLDFLATAPAAGFSAGASTTQYLAAN